MRNEKIPSSLRALILSLNLVNTRQGLTQSQLLRLVPGYEHLGEETARRTFERDLAHLRRSGLIVELSPGTEPRYVINQSSFPASDVVLTPDEVDLLLRAANAWGTSKDAEDEALLNKLRGYAGFTIVQRDHRLRFNLEGSKNLDNLLDGIEHAQAVSFKYASKSHVSLREVAPWKLVSRGRALYLWGFDLNRWGPRLFRLSRFRSVPELIGNPGDVPPEGDLEEVTFTPELFQTEPLLWVREGAAPYIRSRAVPMAGNDDADAALAATFSATSFFGAPSGWEQMRGLRDDAAAWEMAVLRESPDVIVIEPNFLAQMVTKHLEIGSSWGRDENHG